MSKEKQDVGAAMAWVGRSILTDILWIVVGGLLGAVVVGTASMLSQDWTFWGSAKIGGIAGILLIGMVRMPFGKPHRKVEEKTGLTPFLQELARKRYDPSLLSVLVRSVP